MSLALGLAGRVVAISGGTQGVGRGIAERFLAAGAEVIVCARKSAPPVAAAGREAAYMQLDVRASGALEAAFDALLARHGRLDVWINNAGGSPPTAAATASPRFTASIIELNLTAALVCARYANAIMQAQPDGGAIINVCSVSGLRASPLTAAYGAAKAGLLNATESLAVEWAPKVRVNAVTPSLVQTELTTQHVGDAAGRAAVASTVPLGRLATPHDVGNACVYLASPLASYVSGANILVHGGGEMPAFLRALQAL